MFSLLYQHSDNRISSKPIKLDKTTKHFVFTLYFRQLKLETLPKSELVFQVCYLYGFVCHSYVSV